MNQELRKWLILGLSLLLFGALQGTLPIAFGAAGVKPDFLLMLPVLTGYYFGSADGFWFGLASGFVRDLSSGRVLGLGMLILMFFGLSAGKLFTVRIRHNPLLGLAQIGIFTVLFSLIIMLISILFPAQPDVPLSVLSLVRYYGPKLPWQLLANGLGALPLFGLYHLFLLRGGDEPAEGDRLGRLTGLE